MSNYYLMSQLPSLDGIGDDRPLPITENAFLELCNRFLSKAATEKLNKITLNPPRETERVNSSVIDEWNKGEKNLRLALCKMRAEKLKKNYESENEIIPMAFLQAARTAVEITDPLEAEKFLNRLRLSFLETLRPLDTFSEESVFYYCLKLKLISRIKQFNTDKGETAYKKIYSSVINGDELEAI